MTVTEILVEYEARSSRRQLVAELRRAILIAEQGGTVADILAAMSVAADHLVILAESHLSLRDSNRQATLADNGVK